MKNYKEFTLGDAARDAILNLAEKLAGTPEASAAFLAHYIASLLPGNIKLALKDVHNTGSTPLLLLHNLPIDRVIPENEPDINVRLEQKGQVSQRIILALSTLLGAEVIANPKEQNGKLIHDVAPDPAKFESRSSVGVEPLDPHTESPQENNPPHYMLLLGLKGDSHAKTVFFSIDAILGELSDDIIASLKKPLYKIRSGASYTDGITETVRSIIDETTDNPVLHYIKDASRVIALNDEASTALNALNGAIEKAQKEHSLEVTVQAGDALIFNNGSLRNGVMHARAGRIVDTNRWLQRGFLYEKTERPAQVDNFYAAREIKRSLGASIGIAPQVISERQAIGSWAQHVSNASVLRRA